MDFLRRRDGFTVLELTIVVVLFGLLAAFVLMKIDGAKEQAYIDAMMSDLRNYALAEEIYFHDFGTYGTPDEIVAEAFAYSEDVIPNDSSDVRTDGFYHRVAHEKTDVKCEIDYGVGGDNRVRCYAADGQEETPGGANQAPVIDGFTATEVAAGGDVQAAWAAVAEEVEAALRAGQPFASAFRAHRPIQFQADASDPDGDVLNYFWSFTPTAPGTGERPIHEFTEAGTFDVTLTVSDGLAEASLSRQMEVISQVHTGNLLAFWDPCTSFGTQSLTAYDASGAELPNSSGYLGSSTAVDANDPTWNASNVSLVAPDGENLFVTVPNEGLNDADGSYDHTFIVAAAFEPNTASRGGVLDFGGHHMFLHWTESDRILLELGGDYGETGVYPPTDGAMHVYAFAWNADSKSVRIYVDGTFEREAAAPGSYKYYGLGSGDFRFLGAGGHGLAGEIGSVLWYNTTLDDAAIAQTSAAISRPLCVGESPTTVEAEPNPASVKVGETVQLTATARDASGNVLPGRVFEWEAGHPNIATVDQDGVVTGVEIGEARVVVRSGAGADTVTVKVQKDALITDMAARWSVCGGFGGNTLAEVENDTVADAPFQIDYGNGPQWTANPPSIWNSSSDRGYIDLAAGGFKSTARQYTFVFGFHLEPPYSGDQALYWGGYPNIFVVYGGNPRLGFEERSYRHRNLSSVQSYDDGELHTVAVVVDRDASTVQGYVDGQPAYGPQSLDSNPHPAWSTAYLLPRNGTPIGVREAVFYERELSDAEILQTHSYIANGLCYPSEAPATLDLQPPEADLQVGADLQFNATVRDSAGDVMVGVPITWGVSDTTLASIDDTGLLTAKSIEGEVTVTALAGDAGDVAHVTIKDAALPNADLHAHWSTCEGYGGQEFVDIEGGQNVTLGSTVDVDQHDPEWTLDPAGRAMLRSTNPGVTSFVNGTFNGGGATSFTIAAVVRADQMPSTAELLAFADDDLYLRANNSGSGLWLDAGNNYGAFGAFPADGQRHTVAVVVDAQWDSAYVYLDGVKKGGLPYYHSYTADRLTLFTNHYGVQNPTSQTYVNTNFYGSMGDVAYYTDALDATALAQVHTWLMEGTCDFTVAAASIEVVPDSTDLVVGDDAQLEAQVYDPNGTLMVGQDILWSSTDPSIATVDSAGLVTGQSLGTTWVTAEVDWLIDSAKVVVREVTPETAGLVAHWSTCQSYGGQEVIDVVGGQNLTLGSTTNPDVPDPDWAYAMGERAWLEATDMSNNQYAQTSLSNPDLASFTAMALFRTSGTPLYSHIFSLADNITLRVNSNGQMWMQHGNEYAVFGSAPVDGQVHTLAMTANAITDTARIYLDGVEVYKTRSGVTVNPNRFVYMTQRTDATNSNVWYKGQAGDALLYKGELSAAEIQQTHDWLMSGTCDQPTPARIEVEPADTTVPELDTVDYIARAYDGSDNLLTGIDFTWASTDTDVATMSGATATAASAGTATIQATTLGVTGEATLEVIPLGSVDANFTWQPAPPHAQEVTEFTDASIPYNTVAGVIDGWEWSYAKTDGSWSQTGGTAAVDSVTFPDPLGGDYDVTLVAWSGTASDTLTQTVTVRPYRDTDPIARLTATPDPAGSGELVYLDGSLSTAPEGATITRYRFEADGRVWDGSEAMVLASFENGPVDVTLDVWDDATRTDSDSTTVDVAGPAAGEGPTAECVIRNVTLNSTDFYFEGDDLFFDARGSSASEGETLTGRRIDIFHTDTVGATTFVDGAETDRRTVAAAEAGTYTCYVAVEESSGATDHAEAAVTVDKRGEGPEETDGPLTPGEEHTVEPAASDGLTYAMVDMSCTPTTLPVNSAVSCVGEAYFHDPGNNPVREAVSYRWGWNGPGETTHGKVTSHTYREPGIFSVYLIVTDNTGAEWTAYCGDGLTGGAACHDVQPRIPTAIDVSPTWETLQWAEGDTEPKEVTLSARVTDQFGENMTGYRVAYSYPAGWGLYNSGSVPSGGSVTLQFTPPSWYSTRTYHFTWNVVGEDLEPLETYVKTCTASATDC